MLDVEAALSYWAAQRAEIDEHYPEWLATELQTVGVDALSLVADRVDLRGEDDTTVLEAAVAEGRVVVTEDVRTFGVTAGHAPNHVGIVFAAQRRFSRTRPGLHQLLLSLQALASEPPAGLGEHPTVWWID